MSIIAIKGIFPYKCSLAVVVEIFSESIGGPFDVLNFIPKGLHKTFYIRLSETLDPDQVVHMINTNPSFLTKKGNSQKYFAFVAENVPDFSAVHTKNKKKKKYDAQKLDPPHETVQNKNEMSSQDTSSFGQNDYSGLNNTKPEEELVESALNSERTRILERRRKRRERRKTRSLGLSLRESSSSKYHPTRTEVIKMNISSSTTKLQTPEPFKVVPLVDFSLDEEI